MSRHNARSLDNSSVSEAFDGIRSDYNAAKISRYRRRRTGTLSTGSHADWHYRVEADYLRIMEQARDFDRNDCVAGRVVDTFVMNVLPKPSVLDADTGDAAIDDELEARWVEYSEDPEQCDLAGERTFADQERLTLRHAIVDGDCMAIGTDGGQLQMMEAHRLRSPSNTKKNVVCGILLDANRRHLEYWFTKEDVSPNSSVSRVSDMEQVPVRNKNGVRQVFHTLFEKRLSQTRGVSAFAPVFDLQGMFEDVNFAKLVQAQVTSCFAIIRTRELDYMGGNGPQLGTETTVNLDGGATRTAGGVAPGMEIGGQPGEKITGFSPAVPNAEYFQHAKLLMSLISVNIGVPYILFVMDPSEANFSGYRGAMEQARLGFMNFWRRFNRQFHSPIYQFKVRQWMAEDALLLAASKRTGIKIAGHRWTSPKLSPIEPLKDAQTNLLKMRTAQVSPRRMQADEGAEWEDITTEMVADYSFAIRAGLKEAAAIKKDFPESDVSWRDLVPLPTADGITGSLPVEPANEPEPAPPSKTQANGFSRNGYHA